MFIFLASPCEAEIVDLIVAGRNSIEKEPLTSIRLHRGIVGVLMNGSKPPPPSWNAAVVDFEASKERHGPRVVCVVCLVMAK